MTGTQRKLHQGKFHLDIRKPFSPCVCSKVPQEPREAVGSLFSMTLSPGLVPPPSWHSVLLSNLRSSRAEPSCTKASFPGHCCVPCMQCPGCKSNTSQTSGCRQAPQDWGDIPDPLRSGVFPSLSTALQSMGIQPPSRRVERVLGPLGELGKEDPAPHELAGSTRHHSTAHAQPRSHLTHPSTQAKSCCYTPCASVYPVHPAVSTHALSRCENRAPLSSTAFLWDVVLMSDFAPHYWPVTCVGWREFIRRAVMERDAGPFGPHLAGMSTLHPLPSGPGSCTQAGQSPVPIPGDELSREQPSPSPGAWGADDGVQRGLEGLLAGQRGWRRRN